MRATTPSSFPDTRETISMKATQSSSRTPTPTQTPTLTSTHIWHLVMHFILSNLNCGCGKMEKSPHVDGSWLSSEHFPQKTLEASPCMLAERHHSLKLVLPLLSFRWLVGGPCSHSKSTSERTLFFCRPYSLGIQHMSLLPLNPLALSLSKHWLFWLQILSSIWDTVDSTQTVGTRV